MRKERTTLKTAALLPNTGQLDWLPKNPRQWTKEDVARTVVSIEEDTDFLEDRPLLVTPHGKKWVVFAGNLRHAAATEAGLETVPCVVYYPEGEDDHLTVKRRAMKDNGSFGSWDYDELANAWDDLPLEDWGIGIPEMELPEEHPQSTATELGDNNEDNSIRLQYSAELYARVIEALLAFGGNSLEDCLVKALGLDE